MSELRKRFESETGKKVEISSYFDCENTECDYDTPVDLWNDAYIFWLENLVKKTNQREQLIAYELREIYLPTDIEKEEPTLSNKSV